MSAYCPWCGTSLVLGASFCSVCGRDQRAIALSKSTSVGTSVDTGMQPVGTPYPPLVTVNVNTQPSPPPVLVIGSDGIIDLQPSTRHFHLPPILIAVAAFSALALLAFGFRDAVLVMLPVVIGGYAWWSYAGEPRGGHLLDILAGPIPWTRKLAPHQRRALFIVVLGVLLWTAIYFFGPVRIWPTTVVRPTII
jgi:hypothetical protein